MSSRSQSSNRRSSSRRSSRKKGKSKNDLKKTAAQDGTNFWVMLAGFVSGLTVLLLVVSLFTAEKVNPDLANATDDNRAEVGTRVEKQDFDNFVENAKVEQLVEMLKSLQKAQTSIRSEAKYLTNIQRQQVVVDNLMEKPLSDEITRLALLARLKGTSTLFWADQSEVVKETELELRLREVAKTHSVNSDPAIAYEARIQLARLNAVDAMNHAGPVGRELHQLLADFPSDKRVHDTIKNSLNSLVKSAENRPATNKVLDQFFKLPKVKGDEQTDVLYELLRDLENLCELEFFDSLEQAKFTGEAGRDQLRDVCLDLAEIPTAGKEVLGNLVLAARWMESNDYYKHAIDVYKAVSISAERLPNLADVGAYVKQGTWGVKRCESVGKPFNLAAIMYDGKPLKVANFETMPVLLVFWSKTDGTEGLLLKVEAASRRWRANSVKIIAVQVEKDDFNFDDTLTNEKANQLPAWSFCYDDGSGKGTIFSQIPRNRNGRIALLDRRHKMFDVEVDLEELVTSVNSVLAVRIEKSQN